MHIPDKYKKLAKQKIKKIKDPKEKKYAQLVWDLENVIALQDDVINAKEKELVALTKVIDKVQENRDGYGQWSVWYRAWSEYLEKLILKYIRNGEPGVFLPYIKARKKVKLRPGIIDNPFEYHEGKREL